jgi:hypothetical protein
MGWAAEGQGRRQLRFADGGLEVPADSRGGRRRRVRKNIPHNRREPDLRSRRALRVERAGCTNRGFGAVRNVRIAPGPNDRTKINAPLIQRLAPRRPLVARASLHAPRYDERQCSRFCRFWPADVDCAACRALAFSGERRGWHEHARTVVPCHGAGATRARRLVPGATQPAARARPVAHGAAAVARGRLGKQICAGRCGGGRRFRRGRGRVVRAASLARRSRA